MKLETKDLLTGDEISSKEFLELIDFSIKLKEENKTVKENINNIKYRLGVHYLFYDKI